MTMNDDIHPLSSTPFKMNCQRNCERCERKKAKRKSMGEKKLTLLSLLLMFAFIPAWAQDSAQATTLGDTPFNYTLLPFYALTAMVFIAVILVMIAALYMLKILNIMVRQAGEERAQRLGIPYVPQPSWWDNLTQKLNASVPLAEEKDIDMGHDFDGIRELDNHLPPWWKWLFVATVIWGVIYIFIYHFTNSLPLQIGEYQNELASAEEQVRILRASQPAAVIDENTLTYTKDEGMISKGKIIFTGNCVACHRSDGGGNTIGPNLTDNYWLHGGGMKNVFVTIKTGAVEKGMPAWGKAMSPQDVRDVAFYVMSLQGTNPKDGKAPQGELFTPVEEKAPTDSLLSKQ
ncbi:MAG TPA: cbb3-type cytochrome c oxidase N-terminal domain-containing protein [Cyclobacteriaceae bacterium]